jgi:hypothetical protein
MKKFSKLAMVALLPALLVLNCQNNSGDGSGTSDDAKTPAGANSLSFKLNGNTVTLTGIAHTKGAGESFIGKQTQGSYILYTSETTPAVGTFAADRNSVPAHYLQYNEGGNVFYDSGGQGANVSFNITVTATEITGTFSGNVRRNDGVIIPLTDGQFLVNK